MFLADQRDEPDKAEDAPHEGVRNHRHGDRRQDYERAQQDPVEHVSIVVRRCAKTRMSADRAQGWHV
jgi:hypothetical protein